MHEGYRHVRGLSGQVTDEDDEHREGAPVLSTRLPVVRLYAASDWTTVHRMQMSVNTKSCTYSYCLRCAENTA